MTRGEYGRGTIRSRETKKGLVFDLEMRVPGAGRVYRSGFTSREAANAERDRILRARSAHALLRQRTLRASEVVRRWMDATKGRKVGSTNKAYEDAYRLHIAARLTERVDELTETRLQAFVDDIPNHLASTQSGDGYSTARRVVTMLKAAMRWAATPSVRLIEENPLEGVRIVLGRPSKARRPMAPSDFSKLVSGAHSTRSRTLWLLLGMTGARKGEILPLRWSDIDFREHTISITKIATPESRGSEVEDRVKMGQARTIPMDEDLEAALLSYRETVHGKHELLFPSPRRRDKNMGYNALDNWWKRDADTAGLPRGGEGYSIHSIRHMFVTALIDAGVDVKVVSEMVGHSSTVTTLNTYHHVSAASKRKSMSVMGGLLKAAS